MQIKDRNILETLTRKYGKDSILNEISKEKIRNTIRKYDNMVGRRTQLSRIKDSMRNIVEVEDDRESWAIITEYDTIYVLDEASYLKLKDLKKLDNNFEYKQGIWHFNIDAKDWRNSKGDYLFPLTTNEEFANALANAVADALEDKYYTANDNEPIYSKEDDEFIDESIILNRNIDFTDSNTYLAHRVKEFDFLDRDGYIGYVKYYAYANDYMIMWYRANKLNISTTPYAFDIQNGVWVIDKPEFIEEEKSKARALASYIAEVSPKTQKRFKDWHTYLA